MEIDVHLQKSLCFLTVIQIAILSRLSYTGNEVVGCYLLESGILVNLVEEGGTLTWPDVEEEEYIILCIGR